MHDEASLRRLEEMGIDVYVPREESAQALAEAAPVVPRTAARTADAAPAVSRAAAADLADASPRDAQVLLIAGAAGAEALLAGVARTFAFARIACARARADETAALDAARALVVFGEAQARAAGAALSAQRQAQIGWVVAAEAARLRGDALAKRALWGEIKRVVRSLRASA